MVSRLPTGSSGSRFKGSTINSRFPTHIEVAVSHVEVAAGNVPCTADSPVVVTEIPLGEDFADDTTSVITVVVNGQETLFPSVDLAPVETPAPIENVTLVKPESADGEYSLNITSGLPSGCAEFSDAQVEQDGNEFRVEVTNLITNHIEHIACTAIYGYHERAVALGRGITAGEAYAVTINGELALSFTVQHETEQAMIEKESPIESAEVSETEDGYLLTVVSRLPLGSSCSKFGGYQINRRFYDRVEVTVTHFEVTADNVPCTRDLPAVLSEIPLGDGFESGRTYTVSVNGEETSFTAH
ncbi:MAG: hypothetical protein H8E48_03730 [Chloroflexi bacterium]|nr:hypothetical protein [Chloroflexota bacterium]